MFFSTMNNPKITKTNLEETQNIKKSFTFCNHAGIPNSKIKERIALHSMLQTYYFVHIDKKSSI